MRPTAGTRFRCGASCRFRRTGCWPAPERWPRCSAERWLGRARRWQAEVRFPGTAFLLRRWCCRLAPPIPWRRGSVWGGHRCSAGSKMGRWCSTSARFPPRTTTGWPGPFATPSNRADRRGAVSALSESRNPEATRSLQVVATAGHVDHGKSALILRLTGMDPDRLAEEKRRGLTIDLGFAWTALPSGQEIGFVDVPGHERFVRNMLAGVGPVRLVLFVVAADEGWKPQSEEHLQIVDVLGAHGAVVALTKRDLVDEPAIQARTLEVRGRLEDTRLAGSAIVACSASTGEGMEHLIGALDHMVGNAPRPDSTGRPRLFVHRVFTIKGAGTVVTGTLTGGPIAMGQEAEVLPSGHRARIRGTQTHKRSLEVAQPVCRVAE